MNRKADVSYYLLHFLRKYVESVTWVRAFETNLKQLLQELPGLLESGEEEDAQSQRRCSLCTRT